jgi:integrase
MAKRRAKGDGSVYRRKDGRVVGEWEDANGRTRYMTSTKMSKAEMSKAVRKKLQDRDEGMAHDSEGLTVERYMDRWLESVRDRVRPGTFKPYEAIARLHVKPTLGKTKLEKLNAMQLEKLYRQKLDAGLSARRVRYIHVTIHKALKDAVRLQMLARNVAASATPPRPETREMQVLTKDQVKILLKVARREQPRLYALYALACTTGMRQGELIGLQRADVDLQAVTIRVNRSVYNGAISAPKTASGKRTIRLPKLALDALRDHVDEYAGDLWVFPSTAGTSISCHNLYNRSWKPLLKAAGLPHETRFHDLRHTAASLLIAAGVPIPVVSNQLGHANPAITMRVYAHMLGDQAGLAALAMNGLLEEDDALRGEHGPSPQHSVNRLEPKH